MFASKVINKSSKSNWKCCKTMSNFASPPNSCQKVWLLLSELAAGDEQIRIRRCTTTNLRLNLRKSNFSPVRKFLILEMPLNETILMKIRLKSNLNERRQPSS